MFPHKNKHQNIWKQIKSKAKVDPDKSSISFREHKKEIIILSLPNSNSHWHHPQSSRSICKQFSNKQARQYRDFRKVCFMFFQNQIRIDPINTLIRDPMRPLGIRKSREVRIPSRDHRWGNACCPLRFLCWCSFCEQTQGTPNKKNVTPHRPRHKITITKLAQRPNLDSYIPIGTGIWHWEGKFMGKVTKTNWVQNILVQVCVSKGRLTKIGLLR